MYISSKKFRQEQLDKVSTEYEEFKPLIKILKPNGGTEWIAISESEYQEIRDIILK